ncbi:MAG: hemerythrin domain-containing protein [Novosphingobium sp.]|nr:hemerythrin domain-containing protein [Novosphingobium sp.]
MPHVFTDAIALLKADHRKVRDLFRQFDRAGSASRRKAIAREICSETRIHLMVEEAIFSSTFQADRGHEHVRILIGDIESALEQDAPFAAMVAMLSENFSQHVHEQESLSGGLFAMSRKSGVDLVKLRDRITAHKEKFLPQSEPQALPEVVGSQMKLLVAA